MARHLSLSALVGLIRPGERLFVPGASGEPAAFLRELAASPERSRGLRILRGAIPGINRVDVAGLHASAETTVIFMQPGLREALGAGRVRHRPVSYHRFARHLRDEAELDTCILQVSPPDGDGRCSLGPGVEFGPLAQARSRRTLALVNRRTPPMPGSVSCPLEAFEAVAEVDEPLPLYAVEAPSGTASAIAANVSAFVEDGCVLQIGIGKVPDALMPMLRDRRMLRLHSGLLGEAALDLRDAGALDPGFRHESCVWLGSEALYGRLCGLDGFAVQGVDRTHDVRRIGAYGRFTAVNSALAVDLLGQANLESAEGRSVSGVGGAIDFAAAAQLSPGGISVLALPAAYDGGRKSRIVPRLDGGIASLPRTAVDVVVTEHGAADLRGLCVDGRAEALAAVAAPGHRGALADAWRGMRAGM